MTPWHVRWWRWLTNPAPMPGELWRVDGMGPVEVLSTFRRSRFARLEHNGEALSVTFRTQGGEVFEWSAGAFLSRARPGAPSGLLTLRGACLNPGGDGVDQERIARAQTFRGQPFGYAKAHILEQWLGHCGGPPDLPTAEENAEVVLLGGKPARVWRRADGTIYSMGSGTRPTTPRPRHPPPRKPSRTS